jgi:hypothetical protein
MKIKRIHEFEINEGFLSGLFGGIVDVFKPNISKIDSILNKVKKAREEDISNIISVEKEIWNLPKEDNPEYRFDLNNLNRQSRIFSSLKGQEIDSLTKQANKIIDNNPKLQAKFSSGLAKIEADATEKLIKNIKPFKEETYLTQLNKEFDQLVRDANKKEEVYNQYSEKNYVPSDIGEKIPDTLVDFIELPNQESSAFLKNLDDNAIESIYRQLKGVYFDIEVEKVNVIADVRKDIKKARREGNEWLVPSLVQEETRLRYEIRKPMDKIRNKVSIVEREIKSRKYGNR